MKLNKPFNKIVRRERNVLIGYGLLTLLLFLINQSWWAYMGILYMLHLVSMLWYYTRTK